MPLTFGDWVRTIASALSPLLVVIGWWWVNRQHNLRESRKELRQVIDRTQKVIAEAVDTAIRYHSGQTGGQRGPIEAWKMLLAIEQIKSQLILLAYTGISFERCTDSYIRLKRVATGRDFMTSAYVPWLKDDERWMVLLEAANSLTHKLDIIFFEIFNDRKFGAGN